MNIPKISLSSVSFGRVRPEAAFTALHDKYIICTNPYKRRIAETRMVKNIKRVVLEQATNYRYDVDYSYGNATYVVIDNRKGKPLPMKQKIEELDQACAIAKFYNERDEKEEKEARKPDDIEVIEQDILNLVGYEADK